MNKYVLTGGPGVGKSTLLNELKAKGYYAIREVAEGLIDEQLKNGGKILPWKNLNAFEGEVMKRQQRLEERIEENRVAFLDRGLADCVAYYRFYNSDAPEKFKKAAKEAGYAKILLLDPLNNYENTRIRTESEEEAKKIHNLIEQAYKELGYEIIKVPALPIKERVDWVESTLKLKQNVGEIFHENT